MTEDIHPVLFDEFQRIYVRPKSGRALVVGSRIYKTRQDRRKLYLDAVGVDRVAGDGVDVVVDLEEDFGGSPWVRTFDHIDCVSTLEHCKRPWKVVTNLQTLLGPGGTLLLSVPFIWRNHAYPDDYWRFTVSAVRELLPRIEWIKLCYADVTLHDDIKVPQAIIDGHIYFARTEVYGFGSLK